MASQQLQRKGYSEWRSENGIHKNAKVIKPKPKIVETEQRPNAMFSTTHVPEKSFDGHLELTVKLIGNMNSSAKMNPILHDVALEEGELTVWFWQALEGKEIVTAVFHNDVRADLIDIAARKGSYAHMPERGKEPTDVTAFHGPHVNWQEDRMNRPDVLLKFAPPEKYARADNNIGFLHFKGHVIIDFRNNPLKAYNMPLTFARGVEGWRLESIRRTDVRISLKDIEARLPVITVQSANTALSYKPSCDENALAARARRFREKNGGISWCSRDGSAAIRNFMYSLLSPEAKGANEALDRELSKSEMAQLRLLNLGKNPERARKERRSATNTNEAKGKYIDKTRALLNMQARTTGGENSTLEDECVYYRGSINNRYQALPESSPSSPISAESSFVTSELSSSNGSTSRNTSYTSEDVNLSNGNQADYSISAYDENPNGTIDQIEDSRFARPSSDQDSAELRQALSPTILYFFDHTGRYPFVDGSSGNYMYQYDNLQRDFEFVFWPASSGEAPKLPMRGPWSGGIKNWRSGAMLTPVLSNDTSTVMTNNPHYFMGWTL